MLCCSPPQQVCLLSHRCLMMSTLAWAGVASFHSTAATYTHTSVVASVHFKTRQQAAAQQGAPAAASTQACGRTMAAPPALASGAAERTRAPHSSLGVRPGAALTSRPATPAATAAASLLESAGTARRTHRLHAVKP